MKLTAGCWPGPVTPPTADWEPMRDFSLLNEWMKGERVIKFLKLMKTKPLWSGIEKFFPKKISFLVSNELKLRTNRVFCGIWIYDSLPAASFMSFVPKIVSSFMNLLMPFLLFHYFSFFSKILFIHSYENLHNFEQVGYV